MKNETDNTMNVVGLLLNMFIIPGLGSVLAKTKNGIAILILALVSLPLCLILIGLPMLLIAWVWGIVDIISNMN